MSKYKPLTDPITRQEACLILDRKRFDSAVRAEAIIPLGKRSGPGGWVPADDSAPRTAPLVFKQQRVRELAAAISATLTEEAGQYKAAAKAIAKLQPPLTRRQIAQLIGKKRTGILIRTGVLTPYGALTDTQTAAHAYDPATVSSVVASLSEDLLAEARSLRKSSKTRVPA